MSELIKGKDIKEKAKLLKIVNDNITQIEQEIEFLREQKELFNKLYQDGLNKLNKLKQIKGEIE